MDLTDDGAHPGRGASATRSTTWTASPARPRRPRRGRAARAGPRARGGPARAADAARPPEPAPDATGSPRARSNSPHAAVVRAEAAGRRWSARRRRPPQRRTTSTGPTSCGRPCAGSTPSRSTRTASSPSSPPPTTAGGAGRRHRSVRAQTLPRVEMVVIDDGGDTAKSVVAEIGDERVRTRRVPHGGPAAARNVGLAAAGIVSPTSTTTTRFDPGWLKAVVWALEDHPDADVLYGPDDRRPRARARARRGAGRGCSSTRSTATG